MKNKLIELTNNDEKDTEALRDYLRGGRGREGEAPFVVAGLEFTREETAGGNEGDGNEHWIVFSVVDNKKSKTYWEVPGWYASYDGSYLTWDELYQVIPKAKTVTVWEAV